MSLIGLHRTLYSALTGDALLMEQCKGVYDVPPVDAASPYVVVGDTHAVEGRLLDNSENKVFVRLHIWSDYKGRKEILEVAALVRAALPEAFLLEDLEVLRDAADPQWWHGIMTLRTYDR